MEYASGGSVAQAFLHNVSLPLATILPIILPIAALQYLHDREVVDCDIKPGNILLGPGNEVWLGGSGIATTLTAKSPRTTPYSGRKVLALLSAWLQNRPAATRCQAATSTRWP